MPFADLKINLNNRFAEEEINKLKCELQLLRDSITNPDCCYTDEMAQDAAAALFMDGVHTKISFSYNDVTNRINAVVTETDPIFTTSPAFNITELNKSNWNTAFDKYPTNLGITGDTTKTVTLTLNDGSTLTANFSVLDPVIPDEFDEKVKISANDTTSGYLLQKLVAGDNISITEMNDGADETLRLSVALVETDPVAIAKTITLNQGTGIIIAGAATQPLSINPIWNIRLDKAYTDTLYVPLSRTLTINGIVFNLGANRIWNFTTTNIPEGTNLYFTNTRARTAISAETPILYNNISGVISHALSGVVAGTYNNLTVNTHGHVTAATNVAYLTSFTETDPVALAKTITFNQGNGIIITGTPAQTIGNNPLYSVAISDVYVRSLFSAGAGLTYNSTTGQFVNTRKDFAVFRTRFRIGDVGYPQHNTDSFLLTDCVNVTLTSRKIDFYREGELMTEGDTVNGYTYNSTSGLITAYPTLNNRERIIIKVYESNTHTDCVSSGVPANSNFPYTLPITF